MIDSPPEKRCYLCGDRPGDTEDHLFPQGLFPKPMPSNLPRTLPACRQCNEGLSKDEEIFRVFVASGMPAYERQAGFRIWIERIRPDLQRDRPRLKPLMRSLAKKARVVSEAGDFLGWAAVLEMEREPIHRVLHKIAKGLYFLETGHVLPHDVQILVGYGADQPERFVSPRLDKAIKGAKRIDLGNGVVTYWRNTMKDDATASLTWLVFYADKAFLICTFREDVLRSAPWRFPIA